jgi:undecaprenyl-diphosphatase
MSTADRHTALVAAGGVALVVLLALLVVSGASHDFDRALIEVIRSPDLLGPLSFLGTVTELGSIWMVTIVAVLIALVGFAIGPWLHGLLGALVVGIASVANGIVKAVIARDRPDLLEAIVVEPGFSFPSGHSALGMVAWGVLAVLVSRSRFGRQARTAIIAALVILVFLIGVSRIYLGVHYPTDVIAGWVAGGVVVFLYARLTRGVPRAPAVEGVGEDPGAPRSDPPAAA